MKKVVISEAGTAILSGNNVDVQVTNPEGKEMKAVAYIVDDKDLEKLDKIKKEGLKQIKKIAT